MYSKLTESHYRVLHYSIDNSLTHQPSYWTQHVPLSQDVFRYLQSIPLTATQSFTGYIASYVYSKQELFYLLKDTLTNFHVRLHNRFYKQVKGIPQGSVLSVPLCNLYVRAFEKAQFAVCACPDLQVVRFVDDFLIISTSKELIKQIIVWLGGRTHSKACQGENRFSLQVVEGDQRFWDVRKGRERKTHHVTTWCGFTIDSKRHLIVSNFSKYQFLTNRKRCVKFDNQSLQMLWVSVRRVLFVRLNAISKEEPISHEDLNNRLILVYSSVLFTLQRTLKKHRIMNPHKIWVLYNWICQFVAKRSYLQQKPIQWIVAFCMISTLRNTQRYVRVCIVQNLTCST